MAITVAAAVVAVTAGTPGTSGAGPAVASATLVDINGNEVGQALFTSRGDGSVVGRVTVAIDNAVAGNPAEFHGFHVHANNDDDTGDGNTDDGCITFEPGTEPAAASAWFTQVDGHWDDGGHAHGAHTGDLPSLVRQSDGEATIEFVVDKLAAGQLPGKALIVHFAADDFGKHPSVGTSSTTGNAGFRYACGAIVPTASGR
ncbi:MAG TPA: superoxide dismutase family protein [Acidimicrobiales bacterium]|nr:superoxide dismutase family protein [Acidimicrobiales bacterium]